MNWLPRPFCQQLCGIYKIRLDWLKCIDRLGGLPDISHNDGLFIFIAYYFIYFIFCFNRELVQLTVTKSSTRVRLYNAKYKSVLRLRSVWSLSSPAWWKIYRQSILPPPEETDLSKGPNYTRWYIKELYTGFQATFILTYQISTIFARLISNPDRPRERWVKVYAQCSFYFI